MGEGEKIILLGLRYEICHFRNYSSDSKREDKHITE